MTALLQHTGSQDRASTVRPRQRLFGHRLATSSPPRRGASQLLQLLYGDDHTVAGTRAPFRGFQGASASQLRSDTNHERPCTSGCRRHPASRSSAVSLHSQTAVAQRFSCEYRNRKPSAQAWAAWAWEGLVGKRRSPGTAFGPVDRSYVEALSMSSTREIDKENARSTCR